MSIYTRPAVLGIIENRIKRARLWTPPADEAHGVGMGIAMLRDRFGGLVQAVEFSNLITQNGDQVIMDRYANISIPATPTGMRLGTGGSTAASKTGAGATIGSYISGSNSAFEGGFPTSALNGSSRRITFEAAWAAGVATNSAIDEWVIANDAGPSDDAGTAGETVSRAVTGTPLNKTASDSLTITWTHDFEGT
jgi:hypothetical protein